MFFFFKGLPFSKYFRWAPFDGLHLAWQANPYEWCEIFCFWAYCSCWHVCTETILNSLRFHDKPQYWITFLLYLHPLVLLALLLTVRWSTGVDWTVCLHQQFHRRSAVMLSAVATSPPALKSSLLSLFDIKLRPQRVRGLSGLAPKNCARLSAHAHMSAPPL